MFSGIIECVGTVAAVRRARSDAELTLTSRFRGLVLGESIAVNGACMTVTSRRGSTFTVLVSAESLRRTTLGALRRDDPVNLERSLRLSDRLSGHFVFGHVDGIGTVEAIEPEGGSALYRFSLPRGFARFLVEKGSIAVDGVSLTVFDCGRRSFTVAVIPHTAAATTLGRKRPGDRVNLETDMLARYVDRAVAHRLRRS
ncbi:MAG: riboflavin synthase [Deltaproteobacteria bacterium]|nr:riboflavin synthase [Deltaproteobacteria bacterium]